MTRPDGPDTTITPARIAREKRTVAAMVAIYCRGRHGCGRGPLCETCHELLDYAHCRLDRCPFGARKTACVDCPIHCYKPAMRERVKEVMRYAGPRMLLRHPILAVFHLLDGRRWPLDEPAGGAGP
jgi:Nitrous oxide-stimulated promoter